MSVAEHVRTGALASSPTMKFILPSASNLKFCVKQLKDPNLVGHIRRILAENSVAADTLKLELTESTVLSEVESAQGVLANIKALV
jgi:EAL domain-containing protein (putative c-di-GMP-specific phosphodiesterase class I)